MSKVRRAVTLFKQLTEEEQEEFFDEAAEIVGGDLLTLMLFDGLTVEERENVIETIDEAYCARCFEELPENDVSKHSCAAGSADVEAIDGEFSSEDDDVGTGEAPSGDGDQDGARDGGQEDGG